MSDQDHGNKPNSASNALDRREMLLGGTTLAAASALGTVAGIQKAVAQAAPSGKPNILVIMGDDIGWFNIGAYHRGIMAGKTPNLDQLAAEGMMFTDYYAEASCTAGRANFITGELPIRTGLTTVGQAGSALGMPDAAPTIATALKAMGYATGQFGKNHLGDRNQFLPTVHGFDEFFGYLYHLNAMEDPFWYTYPPEMKDSVGPRNLIHSWATDTDDPTEQPRWGRIGRQRIVDEGPLPPEPKPGIKYNMTTFDEVVRDSTIDFIDRARKAGQPFFVWMNTTRVHVNTHLSPKYEALRTPQSDYGLEEAAMAQLDDMVGDVMKYLKDNGLDQNTIVIFTTDNGAEVYTWPDGGTTPFGGAKGEVTEGSFRVPCIIRWPGHVPAGKVENGMMSGLDWFPTLVAAAGDPNIKEELQKGQKLGDKTYKVYLDGYNQMDLITAKGPSQRHEVFYFAQTQLGALRLDGWKYQFIDQPQGWLGDVTRPTIPSMTNLRQDPFERMNWPARGFAEGSVNYYDSFKHEMWRLQIPLQFIQKYAETFVAYPPMQAGASFNPAALRQQIEGAIARAQHQQE